MAWLHAHWHHLMASVVAALSFVCRVDLFAVRVYYLIKGLTPGTPRGIILPSPSTLSETQKGKNMTTLAQLETLAAADLAELASFAALGAKLAPTLETLFPGEAATIALVVNGLDAAPTLIADAEKLIADIGNLTASAQPAAPAA